MSKTATVETELAVHDVATGASLDLPYPVDRPEPAIRKLIKAFSIATVLPLARIGEDLFRAPRDVLIAQSPYVLLVGSDYDEPFTPLLAFSLGSPHINIPRRVTLNAAALRAFAQRRTFDPITLDFEE